MAKEPALFELSPAAEAWASKRRQGLSREEQRDLLRRQQERCALSGARLLFDKQEGTPESGGRGVHPLYPAVDHIDCGTRGRGHQIVCYALNDVKGHVPFECFEALRATQAWKELMRRWRALDEEGPRTREAFKRLIFPNAGT
jgi:hypothetical protein